MSFTLQQSFDWMAPMVRFMPTSYINDEPTITNANIILDTMLSPPFAWNWNRGSTSFSASAQDTVVTLADFNYVEKASISKSGDIKELTLSEVLAEDSKTGRPDYISAQLVSGSSVTFRLLKVPDSAYQVAVTYQKKPTLFTSLAGTWPIPDQCIHIANVGLLYMTLAHASDPRTPQFAQKFVNLLLSANRGVSEMDRNIFIGNWVTRTDMLQSEQVKTQTAQVART